MEFEGAELDSSTLRGLVRTMSGSLDRLTERGGGSADDVRKRSASDEVSRLSRRYQYSYEIRSADPMR